MAFTAKSPSFVLDDLGVSEEQTAQEVAPVAHTTIQTPTRMVEPITQKTQASDMHSAAEDITDNNPTTNITIYSLFTFHFDGHYDNYGYKVLIPIQLPWSILLLWLP